MLNRLKRLRAVLTPKRIFRLVLMVAGGWLLVALILGLIVHFYGLVDRTQSADVIIVLGAGSGPALTRRSIHAAKLWQQGLAPRIICAGGTPGRTDDYSEADGCAAVLREHNVPDELIFLEDQSRSTEENAIYSQAIMAANGWKTAVIVSDGFHLLRAGWIFQQRGLVGFLSPVQESYPSLIEYLISVGREVLALHWQVFKETFHLPVTYVQFF